MVDMSTQEVDDFDVDNFDFKDIKGSKKERLESKMSSCSTDSGISLRMSRCSVSCLISDVDTSGCTVAEVPWQVSRADLVLKVNNTLFAVHRSLISLYSDVLKNIIYSVNFVDEDAPVVTLMEQNPENILELLTYIYFQDKDLTDENVEQLASTAYEFAVDRIVQKCEAFLTTKSKKSPLSILKIATQCGMKDLVEFALLRASRLPGLLKQIEKENLELEIENRLLRLVLARFENCIIHRNKQTTTSSECCFLRNAAENCINSLEDDLTDSSDDSDEDFESYHFDSDQEYSFNTV